jgi:hypothetical protein
MATFTIQSSSVLSCPGGSTQWATITSSYPIVSVGFQNYGNAQNFYASQMFVQSESQAYVQVINNSFTSTKWVIWLVVDSGSDSSDVQAPTLVDTDSASLEKA